MGVSYTVLCESMYKFLVTLTLLMTLTLIGKTLFLQKEPDSMCDANVVAYQ